MRIIIQEPEDFFKRYCKNPCEPIQLIGYFPNERQKAADFPAWKIYQEACRFYPDEVEPIPDLVVGDDETK